MARNYPFFSSLKANNRYKFFTNNNFGSAEISLSLSFAHNREFSLFSPFN